MAPRGLAQGATLFKEGDIAEALFVVDSGALEESQGCGLRVAEHLPGACIGEDAVFELERRRRQTTAVALGLGRIVALCYHSSTV
jgi:CRP-like cAMP-binding protein